jgi:exonuclease VII small subunit
MTMASNVQPYGPPINDALDNPKTTLETLIKLHERAVAALEAQGDLKQAVKRLEKEISRRKGPVRGAKRKKAR